MLPVLLKWGFTGDRWLDSALLVVSELVSNAVRHGGGALALVLELTAGRVTVSVTDGSTLVPRRRVDPGEGGRGLLLIEMLVERWGVADHDGGKRVWVLLSDHAAEPMLGTG